MKRQVTSDYQNVADQYEIDDMVSIPLHGIPLGRITALMHRIGFADVQTAYGNIRVPVEDLMLQDIDKSKYDDDFVDDSLDTWERNRSREESGKKDERMASHVANSYYNRRTRKLALRAMDLREQGFSEMETYDHLFDESHEHFADDEIKKAVTIVYPSRQKEALYWKEKGRKYVPTYTEIEMGDFTCPKCKTCMEQATYKKYTKLYVCPECLWMICPSEMVPKDQEQEVKDDKGRVDFFKPNDPVLQSIIGDE